MKKVTEDKHMLDPLGDPEEGHILTRAIIDTIHEPLIVLDENLRVVVASSSFYRKFDLIADETNEKLFYEIGNGQWNIPELRDLLEKVIPTHTNVTGYAIEHTFPFFGLRNLLLNAREIRYENGRKKMLLSIFDVTEKRAIEIEREKLLVQKDTLLKEMRHRIANSLQLIASILLLKAATVTSKESRTHLQDAHERILSIATVQQQLAPAGMGEPIEVQLYLTSLCASLHRSMISNHKKNITLRVVANVGFVSSDTAVSLGLITTELVINAIKHGFANGRDGNILVTYKVDALDWELSIEDNGVGNSLRKKGKLHGLGTSIIGALANQLQAVIHKEKSETGTKVSIVHKES